jgi:hypothetical protein
MVTLNLVQLSKLLRINNYLIQLLRWIKLSGTHITKGGC